MKSTFSDRCECFDTADGHPTDSIQCTRRAKHTLWRIDIDDVNGTRFCDECGEDAMDSGVFTDENGDSL